MCVCVYVYSSFVCRSVSLPGLIARQRAAHVPVRCLTPSEAASASRTVQAALCLDRLLFQLVPDFLRCPAGQLEGCRSVFGPCTDLEAVLWFVLGETFLTGGLQSRWRNISKASTETVELRALINARVKPQNSVFTFSFWASE